MLGFSPIASQALGDSGTTQATGTISGALAWLEASDSIAMTGSVALVPGSVALAWTETADVVAIAGLVPLAPVVPQQYFLTTISGEPIYFDTPLLENE